MSYLSENVAQLDEALKRADISRKIADSYINSKGSPEFRRHIEVYIHCMASASKTINKIEVIPEIRKVLKSLGKAGL